MVIQQNEMEVTALSDKYASGAAWMNGEVIPIGEASIPVNDWGLIHSDITYDVVPVWNGGFFRIQDYLDRFFESMKALRLDPKMTRGKIQEVLTEMVSISGFRNSYVSMVCSRGLPRVSGSRDPRDCANYFYSWCVPYIHVIKPDIEVIGASALIAESVKRIPDNSINPIVKNYHWGDFTVGLFEAKDSSYETVILTDQDGNITEGPGFNIFAIRNGTLITPKSGVLSGISRKTVLEIAEGLGIRTEIRNIKKTELLRTDEVFISTSGGGVIPIAKVNEQIFSDGQCGAVTLEIRKTYWTWMNSPAYRTEIFYKN